MYLLACVCPDPAEIDDLSDQDSLIASARVPTNQFVPDRNTFDPVKIGEDGHQYNKCKNACLQHDHPFNFFSFVCPA
jgi:hypothetical protein